MEPGLDFRLHLLPYPRPPCAVRNLCNRKRQPWPLSLQPPKVKPPQHLETELLQLQEENLHLRSQLGQMDPKGMSSLGWG